MRGHHRRCGSSTDGQPCGGSAAPGSHSFPVPHRGCIPQPEMRLPGAVVNRSEKHRGRGPRPSDLRAQRGARNRFAEQIARLRITGSWCGYSRGQRAVGLRIRPAKLRITRADFAVFWIEGRAAHVQQPRESASCGKGRNRGIRAGTLPGSRRGYQRSLPQNKKRKDGPPALTQAEPGSFARSDFRGGVFARVQAL